MTQIDHNLLKNYVLEEHIDWTNATENFVTTGTVIANKIIIGDQTTITGTSLQIYSNTGVDYNYNEVAQFNTILTNDTPYITIGKPTEGTGGWLSYDKPGQLLALGQHSRPPSITIDLNNKVSILGTLKTTSETSNKSFVQKISKEIVVEDWTTITSIQGSNSGWGVITITAEIIGHTNTNGNGAIKKRFLIGISSGVFAIIQIDEIFSYKSGTVYPGLQAIINNNIIHIQARSEISPISFEGMIDLEIKCPRTAGTLMDFFIT